MIAIKHIEQIVVEAKAAAAIFARNNVLPGVIPCSDYIGVAIKSAKCWVFPLLQSNKLHHYCATI